jgi:hypothetical protein
MDELTAAAGFTRNLRSPAGYTVNGSGVITEDLLTERFAEIAP